MNSYEQDLFVETYPPKILYRTRTSQKPATISSLKYALYSLISVCDNKLRIYNLVVYLLIDVI